MLQLLHPNQNDEKEKNQFKPPSIKHDPLLRQLIRNPQNFKDDFLELPVKTQDNLIELIEEEKGNDNIIHNLVCLLIKTNHVGSIFTEKVPFLRRHSADFFRFLTELFKLAFQL